MTDYLDRLETELVRAGFHQRRPRVPVAPIAAALTIVLVAVLLLYPQVGDERERVAEPAGQVDASFDGVIIESPPPTVRVGFTAQEPLTYVVETGGAAESGRLLLGQRYVTLDLPEDATEVKVTLTDDDGNERTFEQAVKLPAKAEPPLLGDDNVVAPPKILPDVFDASEIGADPVVHELFSDKDGDAWLIEGERRNCLLFYGPANAIVSGCLVGRAESGPVFDGDNVMVVVPDGTSVVEVPDGGTLLEKDNVLIVFGIGAGTLRWRTPAGSEGSVGSAIESTPATPRSGRAP